MINSVVLSPASHGILIHLKVLNDKPQSGASRIASLHQLCFNISGLINGSGLNPRRCSFLYTKIQFQLTLNPVFMLIFLGFWSACEEPGIISCNRILDSLLTFGLHLSHCGYRGSKNTPFCSVMMPRMLVVSSWIMVKTDSSQLHALTLGLSYFG